MLQKRDNFFSSFKKRVNKTAPYIQQSRQQFYEHDAEIARLKAERDKLKEQKKNESEYTEVQSSDSNKPSLKIESTEPSNSSVKTQKTNQQDVTTQSSPAKIYDTSEFDNSVAPNPFLEPEKYQKYLEKQQNKTGMPGSYENIIGDFAKNQIQFNKSLKEQPKYSDTDTRGSKINKLKSKVFLDSAVGKVIDPEDIRQLREYHNLTMPDDYTSVLLKDIKDDNKEQIKEPENYFGQNSFSSPILNAAATVTQTPIDDILVRIPKAIGFLKSQFFKSASSRFIEATNQAQAENSGGKITRSNELLGLADRAQKYADITNQYAHNQAMIDLWQKQRKGADAKTLQALDSQISDALEQNKQLRAELSDGTLQRDIANLASWEHNSTLGKIASNIDNLIDDDLGGIRGKLTGLGTKLDNLNTLMNNKNRDLNWSAQVSSITGDIARQLDSFKNNTAKKQQIWQNEHKVDIKDYNDWKTGNNWLGFKTNVDNYYKTQEEILQKSNYDWSDIKNTALFGWAGMAGGSNTSWAKSVASTAISSAALLLTGGESKLLSIGAKQMLNLGATGAVFELNKAAGSDENNIEALNRTKEGFLSQLRADGAYDKFIKEGIQRLSNDSDYKSLIKNTKDDDVLKDYVVNAYLTGLWQSENPYYVQRYADAIVGSNDHFYNNQPVNTGDAAVDAVLSTARLAPIKQAIWSTRVGGRFLRRKFAKTAIGELLGNQAERAGLRFAGVQEAVHGVTKKALESEISQSIKSGATKIGSLANGVVRKANAPFLGVERSIANATARVREFATRIPSIYLHGGTAVRTAKNITGRLAGETASEMMQEGIQGLNAYDDPDNPTPYDRQHNRSMIDRIYDDVIAGTRAANLWLHQNDPAYHTDADVVGSMNATPLLTLFGLNSIQIGVQGYNSMHEFKINNAIINNVDVAKRAQTAELEQGYNFAKFVTKSDRELMLKQFDRYSNIVGLHRDAIDDVNGTAPKPKTTTPETLTYEDEHGIPLELIEDQKKQYEDIYNLANSESAKVIASRAQIKPFSNEYARMVSMLNFRQNRYNEAYQSLRDVDNDINDLFGDHIIAEDYDEGDTKTQTEYSQQNTAKRLSNLWTLFQMLDDYNNLEEITGKDSMLQSKIQKRIKHEQDQLKKDGIQTKIKSQQDVEAFLNNSVFGQRLQDVIHIAKLQSGQQNEDMSINDILEGISQYQRDRELKQFDVILQRQLLEDFITDPTRQLQLYSKTKEDDKKLEQTIEKDYIQSIYDAISAVKRQVKDNDVYVGDDGLWYKTKQKTDENGKSSFVKQRYHPNSKKTDDEELPFNIVEYDKSKKREAEAIEKRKKLDNANKNIQNGTEKQKEVQPNQSGASEQSINKEEYEKPESKVSELSKNRDFNKNRNEISTEKGTIIYGSPIQNGKTGEDVEFVAMMEDGSVQTLTAKQISELRKKEVKRQQYEKPSITVKEKQQTKVKQVVSNTVKHKTSAPNAQQSSVMEKLRAKRESDKQIVKRDKDGKKITTAHNYFIKIKDKFLNFIRVHGIIDNMFDSSEEKQKEILNVKQQLIDVFSDKNALKLKIQQLYDDYNNALIRKYGIDSFEYARYSIDPSPYLTDEALSDIDTTDAVVAIVTNDVPGAAVIAGQIVDDISREFFENDGTTPIQNKPEYKMSQATFENIILQLNELNDKFINAGWVLDTTPYTWYTTLPDGRRVAGETDMLAIDPNGNIHILDFKTTRSPYRFNITRQVWGKDPITQEEMWIKVSENSVLKPNQTERRTSPFVDDEHPSGAKRSYAAQYAMQLDMYKHMVQQSTGYNVASLQIVPFYIKYTSTETDVSDMVGAKIYDLVNLSEIDKVKQYLDQIDSLFENQDTQKIDDSIIKMDIADNNSMMIEASNISNDVENVDKDLRIRFEQLLDELSQLNQELQNILKQDKSSRNTPYIENVLDNAYNTRRQLKQVIDDIIQAQPDEVVEEGNDWMFGPLEPITPSEEQFWHQFNNLHSLFVKNIPGYLDAVKQPDFITNSVFKIHRKQDGIFVLDIEYKPDGGKPKFTANDIIIRLGNNAVNKEDRNKDFVPGQESAMGRNLIRQFVQLSQILKPNESIVVSDIRRTNGKLIYSEDKYFNLQDTEFFSQNDPRLLKLLNGRESLIGVVDDTYRVIDISTDTRDGLFYPEYDKDGNGPNKNYNPTKPGNSTSSWIPRGSVIFLHKFKNLEDKQDQEERTVPIALRGRKMSDDDVSMIIKIISNYDDLNKSCEGVAIDVDGSQRIVTVPGFTNYKALQLLTRFGKQAISAGHEFIFQYNEDDTSPEALAHKEIIITDMTDPGTMMFDSKQNTWVLTRPKVKLNLTSEADLQRLRDILKNTEIHINQFGIMRAQVNSTQEDGWFGAIGAFMRQQSSSTTKTLKFNETLQFDSEDVFPDTYDIDKSLSGIGWYIKRGIAVTNAIGLENPLISVHGLDKVSDDQKSIEKTEKEQITENDQINNTNEQIIPAVEDPVEDTVEDSVQKQEEKYTPTQEEIDELLNDDDNMYLPGFGLRMASKSTNINVSLTHSQEALRKRIKRLIGDFNVEFLDSAQMALRYGANVAGNMAEDAITISTLTENGVEYHEAFHRIFEVLMPNKRRQVLYEHYRKKYNDAFRKTHGRDLTEREIAEEYAEMFRSFMTERDRVKLHWNLLKTFNEIKQYVDAIIKLGDWKFAKLFILANSGIYRFIKPDAKNLQHFKNTYANTLNMKITAMYDKQMHQVELETLPRFGGGAIFADAINGLVHSIISGYQIDAIADNALDIKVDRTSITEKLFRGKETTKHSTWFRVLTGEYTTSNEGITMHDAAMYKRVYRNDEEIKQLTLKVIAEHKDSTPQEKRQILLQEIISLMSKQKPEDLNQSQKIMAELLSEKAWNVVNSAINKKLESIGLSTKRRKATDPDKTISDIEVLEDDREEEMAYMPTEMFREIFYDHDRMKDADAAVRFLLSTMPDERFATQVDVENGIVKATVDEKGRPALITNNTNLLGYVQYLSMQQVSNELLIHCCDVVTAQELNDKLESLAKQKPMFYRLYKIYNSYLEQSVLKHEDGKPRITVNGVERDTNTYQHHYDENGVYYTEIKDGEDTNQRIIDAVTMTDVAKEAFVTQFFNYVSSQRLDFIQVVLTKATDENGNEIKGRYSARVQSSDSDYSAILYPKNWFIKLKSGVSGIFKASQNGKLVFSDHGRERLNKAIATLQGIYDSYTRNQNVTLDGHTLNRSEQADFQLIIDRFIKSLNTLGIDINADQLSFKLHEYYKTEETGLSLQDAFGQMLTQAKQDLSFKVFLQQMTNFSNTINNDTADKMLRVSQKQLQHNGIVINEVSGINVYSDSSFVKWLANGVGRYTKMQKQLMTNGPSNTKQYTIAQKNSASEITSDINRAKVDESGEITGSQILRDVIAYGYNFQKKTSDVAGRQIVTKIGSIIAKHFLNGNTGKLKLHVNSGVRVQGDYNGGKKYTEITPVEDLLAKVTILQDGGIIFPTLSDKSTWFHLSGVTMSGLNYDNLVKISTDDLLSVQLLDGQKLSSTDLHIAFDFDRPNAQIDQMIEYAICERDQIEKELNRKTVLDISNWNKNRLRFGGLSEIITLDDNGNPKLILLNDYDKSPNECLELADKIFFGDHVSQSDRRKMIVMSLETGFNEMLNLFKQQGLIEQENQLRYALDENGEITDNVISEHMMLSLRNVGLNANVIDKLKSKYLQKLGVTNPTEHHYNVAESQAVIQYLWDIYMRGIISNEEVERVYTGAPQFFKWRNEEVKDPNTGKLINALVDRHSDQTKRLGGLGSTGESNRLDLPDIKLTYRTAEITDQEVVSQMMDDLQGAFIDNEIRQVYLDTIESQLKEQLENSEIGQGQYDSHLEEVVNSLYDGSLSLDDVKKELELTNPGIVSIAEASGRSKASNYGNINVTDGAAYISPIMTKQLLRMRGAYTSDVKEAFEYLEGKKRDNKYVNPLKDSQAYQVITKALLGAQKYTAYGYRTDPRLDSDKAGSVMIHYYDKFALFPLFEYMATGFTQNVIQKMKEDGVEMLMFNSCVKTGSQDAVEFNPDTFQDAESFANFHFKSYDQKYQFLRRQLNTDPHEHNETTAGTQMTKVALSNLNLYRTYNVHDKKMSGKQLLSDIMDSINELSDIGYSELKEQMFDDNGLLDMDKFAQFLREELESRDANDNLLDGIEIIEEDGVKDFKIPLEAMSSIKWIESILISKINKEVVDINIDGNAFYQRSVWGMEGKPTVLSSSDVKYKMPELNNGEDLMLVNEDGSMDAVISIDFFSDIVPHNIRNNFEKARTWLIENKIIGQGAEANTISARIPTQAQSSISAIRFVDVLPIVRATIVLPKDFTSLTGADFDIDKLYLARKSYNKTTVVDEQGNKITTISTEFDKDTQTKKYHRNRLIDGYLTLLKDHGKYDKDGKFVNGASAHISLRPVDKDTELIKNVLRKIEGETNTIRYYAYKFGNLAFQVSTKIGLVVGKFGIGPFALNNNSQILTQLYGVKFKNTSYSILKCLGCTDLSKSTDMLSRSILQWISGLINAHVDVAKDPYIARLNVNKFTYNLINLLIRTGMSDKTFFFTTQPIMKELAEVYSKAESEFMNEQGVSASTRQRRAVKQYILDRFSNNGFSRKLLQVGLRNDDKAAELLFGKIVQQIFGIDDDGKQTNKFEKLSGVATESTTERGSILEDMLHNPDVLISTKEPLSTSNMQNDLPVYRIQLSFNSSELSNNEELLDDEKFVYNEKIVYNEKFVHDVKISDDNGKVSLDQMRELLKRVGLVMNDENKIQMDLTPFQVQMLVAITNQQLSKYGDALSSLVNACKIDTKKHGKSFVEQRSFLEKVEDVFGNYSDDLFDHNGLDKLYNESYIGKKIRNATGLYKDIIENISLQADGQLLTLVQNVSKTIGSDMQDSRRTNKIVTAVMKNTKRKIFDAIVEKYAKQTGNENYANDLFYGNDTVQDNLIRIKNLLQEDQTGEYRVFINNGTIINILLNQMQSDFYEEDASFNNPKFVIIENALTDDSQSINQIIRAWDDLFNDDEHFITQSDGSKKTFRQFAIDLAIYAFYTSGDTGGKTKIFKFVPNTIRTEIGYVDYMKDLMQNGITVDHDDVDRILLDNWYDSDFIPEFEPVRLVKGRLVADATQYITFTRNTTKQVYENGIPRIIIEPTKVPFMFVAKNQKGATINQNDDGNYPRYVKVRRNKASRFEKDATLLYKFIQEKDGAPVYSLVLPTSNRMRAGSYDFEMITPRGVMQNSYPNYILQAIDDITNRKYGLGDLDKLLQEFFDQIANLPVEFMTNDAFELILENEYISRHIDTEHTEIASYIEQAGKWVHDMLDYNKKYGKATQEHVVSKSSAGDQYINHSGGAIGSDTVWGEIGQQYGVKSNHYYHGNKTPNGNVEITQEQFEEGKKHVLEANKTLNRRPDKYMSLLARNYEQVRNADAIFAVGHIKNGIVDGGTGWAVQMAIDDHKPVYMYDQIRKQWYQNHDKKWSVLNETPTLTKNFAGIGTRQINNDGIQAIRDVYSKTFGKAISNNSQQHELYDKVKNNQKSHVQIQSWSVLKNAKTPLIEQNGEITAVVATRVSENQEHSFGNTYTSDKRLVDNQHYPMQLTQSTRQSVEKFIDAVINPEQSNWVEHYKWIQEHVKSGKLKGLPILYYKNLGEPSHATALDYLINEYDWSEENPIKQERKEPAQLELFDDSEFETDNMEYCKKHKPNV